MRYLKEKVINEFVISKSRFIGIVTPITNESEMSQILKQIKKDYPKATHYCTAYVFLESQGSNDDGEPSGTAGVPILEILNQYNLKNVYAVVVRYYGGIHLGAGGLIRSYAKATKDALSNASFLKKVLKNEYIVSFNYDKQNDIDQIFNSYIIKKEYTDIVTYTILIDDNSLIRNHEFIFNKVINNGPKEILIDA